MTLKTELDNNHGGQDQFQNFFAKKINHFKEKNSLLESNDHINHII